MVIVMVSLTFTGVSIADIVAYAWGFAMEMTKLMSCEGVSLRRCDTMYDPSCVGSSDGDAIVCFATIVLVDVR